MIVNVKAPQSDPQGYKFNKATEIEIQTDDAEHPILIQQLANGEVCVLYEGECYLSCFGPVATAV